jgi:hypothetical protein
MGIRGIAPPFLTSALDGGEWSASRPGRFTVGEIASQSRSGRWGEEKNPARQVSNSGHPAHSASLYGLIYVRISTAEMQEVTKIVCH